MIAVERQSLLSRDKAEALAEFEKEAFDAIDDRLLEIALVPMRLLAQRQDFED